MELALRRAMSEDSPIAEDVAKKIRLLCVLGEGGVGQPELSFQNNGDVGRGDGDLEQGIEMSILENHASGELFNVTSDRGDAENIPMRSGTTAI